MGWKGRSRLPDHRDEHTELMTTEPITTNQSRGAGGQRRSPATGALLWALALLVPSTVVGCQAPGGASPFAYGAAPECDEALLALDKPIPLTSTLAPLRQAFDEHSEMPRVVALMPHMGCEGGAAILRREVLSAHEGEDLALFVIWQDEARLGGAAAAARASEYLKDPRVIAFHDCGGVAGRGFARGNLPVAEAREVFLFYPAGIKWPSDGTRPRSARPVSPERPPQTDKWVHQLGRVAPERFCTAEELPQAIRLTLQRLMDDAKVRRGRLESQQLESELARPASLEPKRRARDVQLVAETR